MKFTTKQAVQRRRGIWPRGLWAVCFCLLTATRVWAKKPAHEDNPADALIQIGVEVVEGDEKKRERVGGQWINAVIFAETPSVLNIGTITRTQIKAAVEALIQEGAADLLANPKLVTRNGTTATFHAGGEIPYVVSSGLGNVTVEFKPYGVNLQINPKLNEENKIVLTVNAEITWPE